MKASDYIAETLQKRGVTHVFELVGGMITFLLDALARQPKIQIVSMHHEQGAGFAAEGFGRMTGVPGVAMATSGPGATNLLTAIGNCYFDSTPAVFITGQVNTHEQKCLVIARLANRRCKDQGLLGDGLRGHHTLRTSVSASGRWRPLL